MLSVVGGDLAPVPWEDLDPAMVQEIQRESSGYTLDVPKEGLCPQDAVETTPREDDYVVSDAAAPTPPAVYLILMYSQNLGYPSYPTQYTLMTKPSMTPSSFRRAWRKWRTPSTLPNNQANQTEEAEPVDDILPASIHQGASKLHWDEDVGDKIKLSDPRVQKLISNYLEVFGKLPRPATCDKLVQLDLKLKREFVGHKIRHRP